MVAQDLVEASIIYANLYNEERLVEDERTIRISVPSLSCGSTMSI